MLNARFKRDNRDIHLGRWMKNKIHRQERMTQKAAVMAHCFMDA